jgi:PhnB protein
VHEAPRLFGFTRAAALLICLVAESWSTPSDTQPSTMTARHFEPTKQEATDVGSHSMQLTAYLFLPGTCKDAMTFYHEILGGELVVTTVGESPMKAMFPPSMHGRIVNARLKSELVDISASDWLRPTQAPIQGNTVCLYLSGGSREETKATFTRLSGGADVPDPVVEQPFGLYGALNDRYGNRWMFHAR